MRRLKTIALACVTFVVSPARAADTASGILGLPAETLDRPGELFCFPSGLQLHATRDSSQPVVAVQTVIDGGRASDPPSQPGLAHLIEHLWYRSRPEGGASVSDRLNGLGVAFNAYTMADLTLFEAVGPSSSWPQLVALEAARLQRPLEGVSQEAFEQERAVVRAELQWRGTSGLNLLPDQLFAAVYPPDHPYARLATSQERALDTLQLGDALAAAEAMVRPAHVSIVVTGDISPHQTAAALKSTLGDLALKAPPEGPVRCDARRAQAPPSPPPSKRPPMFEIQADVEHRMLVLAWRLPPAWQGEDAVARVAVESLESVLQRRARQAFPQERPSEIDAGCGWIPGAQGSLAACLVGVPGVASASWLVPRLTEDHDKTLAAAAATSLTSQLNFDLSLNQGQFVATASSFRPSPLNLIARSIVLSTDGVGLGGRSDGVLYGHYTGTASYVSQEFERLRMVRVEDVAAFSKSYLYREAMFTGMIRPRGGTGLERSGDVLEGAAPTDAHVASLPWPAEAPPEELLLAVRPKLDGLRTFTLENGLRVSLLPNGETPVVRVTLALKGGPGTAADPALPEWSRRLIDLVPRAGASALDAVSLGVEGRQSWSSSAWTVSMRSPAAFAAYLVDQLGEKVREAQGRAFVQRELAAEARYYSGLRRAEARDPAGLAQDQLISMLLPGTSQISRLSVLRTLSEAPAPDALQAWQTAQIAPGNAHLVIVGRMNVEQLEARVRKAFGTWESPPEPLQQVIPKPAPAPEGRSVVSFDAQAPGRANIELLCRLSDPDPDLGDLLARFLGRLAFAELRQEAGIVYTPQATRLSWGPWGQGLSVYSDVASADAGEAAARMLELVAEAQEMDQARLAWLEVELIRGRALDFMSTGGLTRVLLQRDQNSDAEADLDPITAVTTERVRAALSTCVGHEVLAVWGDAEARASLTAMVGASD